MSKSQTVLITGANRGLGLAHTQAFLQAGATVYAAVRAPSEAAELHQLAGQFQSLHILPYDASIASAPTQLKAQLGNTPIDLLFANAGANAKIREQLATVESAVMAELFQINTIAPLQLARALVENVLSSTRKIFAFQSSLMGSLQDNTSGGSYSYRISKTALNMAAKNLAEEFRARGVVSVALHPGWVRTRMGGEAAPLSIEQSVEGQQALLAKLGTEHNGQFFNWDGATIPW